MWQKDFKKLKFKQPPNQLSFFYKMKTPAKSVICKDSLFSYDGKQQNIKYNNDNKYNLIPMGKYDEQYLNLH